MQANFRHVCTTFTAEGAYTLKNDFLDEIALPNNTIPTRISMAIIRPSSGAAVSLESEPVTPVTVPTSLPNDTEDGPGSSSSDAAVVATPAVGGMAGGDGAAAVAAVPMNAAPAVPMDAAPAVGPTKDLRTLPSEETAHIPSPEAKAAAPAAETSTFGSIMDALSPLSYFMPTKRGKKTSRNGVVGIKDGSFILKTYTSEKLELHPKFAHPSTKGQDNVYLFFNVNNSLIMADYYGNHKGPLEKLTFNKTRPTCHDVNVLTRSSDRLELIVGFTKGDLLLYDPFSRRQVRFNKGGIMNSSMVTCIKWIPGSETQFLTSFNDGCIMIFDTEREDAPLNVSPNESDMFFVTHPKTDKQNPVACWQIGRSAITAFAFSPDCEHLATAGRDGCLRIFDFKENRLIVTFKSYFGGLLCVNWSPDGKYLITGGEDDLVSIWAFNEQRLVARCEGHQSWVSDVAFDPHRCDDHNYRFGSVGEDTRLLLWDFSVNALNRPRAISFATRPRSHSSNPGSMMAAAASGKRGAFQMATVIEPLPMSEVPTMEPVVAKKIHTEPLSAVRFREDAILTGCRRGHIKVWQRPAANSTAADLED